MTLTDGEPLGDDTITVVRPGSMTGEDAYGNPVTGADITFTIPGCSLQPLVARNVTSETQTAAFDAVVSRWHLFLPAGSDLIGTDRVTLGNLHLEVDGDVMDWLGDDYGDGHREAYLKRWEG